MTLEDINNLDNTDKQIINLLESNGRMSYSDMGKDIGLSRVAVKNRIQALEEKGIIEGYTVRLRGKKEDTGLWFIVSIQTEPGAHEAIIHDLQQSHYVKSLYQTSGECSLYAFCRATAIKDMRSFINEFYKSSEGIRRISCHTVLDVLKEEK